MKQSATFAAAAALLAGAGAAHAALVNGSFEQLNVAMPAANYIVTNQSNVPGWRTTATDGNLEIWQQPGPDPTATPADLGTRYAEINATQTAQLYQDTNSATAGSIIGWQLSHRGRFGTDVMRMTITDLGTDGIFGTGDDTTLFTRVFTDGNTAWGRYSGTGITSLGNTIRIGFAAISSVGPDTSYGNFLDAVDIAISTPPTGNAPEPASVLLVGTALLAAGAARRRRS